MRNNLFSTKTWLITVSLLFVSMISLQAVPWSIENQKETNRPQSHLTSWNNSIQMKSFNQANSWNESSAQEAYAPNVDCLFTSSFGSGTAPTEGCLSVQFSSCNYAGEYATMNGAVAGTSYTFSSSMATDYLTIRQGTYDGPIIGQGLTPVTVTVTVSGSVYMHIAADSSCTTGTGCRVTTAICASCTPPADFCAVTSTNTNYGIANVTTTNGVDNINNTTGSGTYSDYTAMFASQFAGGTVDFSVSPVNTGTSHGYGVWIDWGSNNCFYDAGDTIARTTSYVSGSFTGTITVPAGTPAGDYRMRIVNNYLSGSPIPCGNLGSGAYGEAEDYTFRVIEEGGTNDYCIPEGITSTRYIDNFTTTGGSQNISNLASGFSPGGYGDFHETMGVTQAHEGAVNFTANIMGGTAGFRVWVDWNQDGEFDIVNEVAYQSSTYASTQSGSFVVPAGALEGTTRMRIVSHWLSTTGNVDPCETGFTYGEFEDYSFTVEGGGGTGGSCEQDYYSSVAPANAPTGLGFSAGNKVANDILIPAGESFTIQSITFEMIAISGDPTEFDLEVFADNGTGGVGTTTGITQHFDSSNMSFVANGIWGGAYPNYTVTLDVSDIELNADPSVDTTYWLSLASELTTTGGYTYWTVDTFDTSSTSNPAWQNTVSGGGVWFEYSPLSEGYMLVEGICGENGGGTGVDCPIEYTGDFIDGLGSITDLVLAADFPVPAGETWNLDTVRVQLLFDTATVDVSFYQDNGGQPGAQIVAPTTLIPVSQTAIGVAGALNVYDVELDVSGLNLSLTGGMYWMGITTTSPELQSYWHYTETVNNGTNFWYSVDNYGSWADTGPVGFPVDGAFSICVEEGGEPGIDCDQGDDSNAFENGFQISAGSTYRNADDFFVSAGNTLNVQQIEINVFSMADFTTMNFNFYEDDGGVPGSTIVYSLTDVPVETVAIGANFGYTVYATFAAVDLDFTEGHYWMQPEANNGGQNAFWEITTLGSLGDPIANSNAGGAWTPDPDSSQGVFKLHCEPVTPPDEQCLFDITSSIEPISRVILSDIDNSSDPTINGSPALEDFTSIIGHLAPGGSYSVALEGNTGGSWTNYFTLWIDFDQSGTYENSEMFEIGSIANSTGTDGQQAVNTIVIPTDALMGSTTMRVIKNFNNSPTNPCGQYSFGQGEDYGIEIEELLDCAGTPEGGTVTVNPDHGNPGSTYTVSSSGYSFGNGLTYQWQSNTAAAGWVNEGAATSSYASYVATAPSGLGTEVEWRLEVTCTLSGETALSTTDIFTVELVYCDPEVSIVEPITRVDFADIDNSSDPNSTIGYEDFTSIIGNVNQASSYDIALEGNTAGNYTNYFTVWVDWNYNGTFEVTEMYEIGSITNSTGTDGQQAIGNITVPTDAVIGLTRMRVIKNYASSPTDPCGSYTFGQIEDYTINVGSLGTGDIGSYDFTYYPNPVKDVLNINSQKNVESVSVFNLAGQKVISDAKINNGQINLSALNPGAYVLRVVLEGNKVETFKIIKK